MNPKKSSAGLIVSNEDFLEFGVNNLKLRKNNYFIIMVHEEVLEDVTLFAF